MISKREIELRTYMHINKRLIKTVAFGGVVEGPNKPGRPRKEWLDVVKE